MSTVKDEIKRQAPLQAMFFQLSVTSATDITTIYPSAVTFFSLDDDPVLAGGSYAIRYFRSNLTPIHTDYTPSVVLPPFSAQNSWRELSKAATPQLGKQLELLPSAENTVAAATSDRKEPESAEEREYRQRMDTLRFEQAMLRENQKLLREQLGTQEIGQVYNHQHSGRLELQLERQNWMEERQRWMKLQMEAEKMAYDRLKMSQEVLAIQYEALQQVTVKAIQQYSAPPPPPTDYTPVLMQAVLTGGGIMSAYLNKGTNERNQLTQSAGKKLFQLSSPEQLAQAFAKDPAKLAEFLKEVQSAFDPASAIPPATPPPVTPPASAAPAPAAPPAAPAPATAPAPPAAPAPSAEIAALQARLEEIRRQIAAKQAETAAEPTTKVVES